MAWKLSDDRVSGNPDSRNRGAEQEVAGQYRRPRLLRYGRVADLTGGAAGSGTDSGGGWMNRHPPTDGGGPPMGMGMGMGLSDQRCKQAITRIGTHPLGFGLYLFEYASGFRSAFGGHGRHFGVLAQEVAPVLPQAVHRDERGLMHVDYSMLAMYH